MEPAVWVINVLEDSKRKSIEYENKIWLRNNVDQMNIRVCVEDCNVDIRGIKEEHSKEGTILVQKGNVVQFGVDFQPKMEALLILKRWFGHVVFQYFPEATK